MAEQDDDSQKTEDPTAKRVEESRKKGQVALSRELNSWLMLLAGTVFIVGYSGPIVTEFYTLLRVFLESPHAFSTEDGGPAFALQEVFLQSIQIMALPVLLLMSIAIMGPIVQVGPLFAPEAIKMDLSKLSPIEGFQRLFSIRSIIEFVKGLVKIGVVSLVGYMILEPYFGTLEHLIDMPMVQVMQEMRELVLKLMTGVLVVVLIVALGDVFYQRMEYYKKMRMSRQEVRDEMKQSEGDPHVKARLRGLRAEKARQRMIQNVPQADVVITNPTHYAIALKYDPKEMAAPVCVAKGLDEFALRIREVAGEHKVEIVENKPLARALFDVIDVDEAIPPEFFKAVAEIISFVFKKRGKTVKT